MTQVNYPNKAVDETEHFLSGISHENIRDAVDCILDNLVNCEKCYYQDILIFSFGGVEVLSLSPVDNEPRSIFTVYSENGETSTKKAYFRASELFNAAERHKFRIKHLAEPKGYGNNFLHAFGHLVEYLDMEFANSVKSLFVLSDMKFCQMVFTGWPNYKNNPFTQKTSSNSYNESMVERDIGRMFGFSRTYGLCIVLGLCGMLETSIIFMS